MKKFTIFTIVICSFCLITTNESKANKNNKLQKFETSIKLGASKHNVGFDTPYTHSVLSWDTDTIDLGLDIKYNISDKMFTLLEYNYGTIKGGMLPKIKTCFNIIKKGVKGVVIIDGRNPNATVLELFTKKGAGTLISK